MQNLLIDPKAEIRIEKASKMLNEAFRKENFNGSWTKKQLSEMQALFNSSSEEEERRIILFRFFNANLILNVIVGNYSCVSENAFTKDQNFAEFDRLHRNNLISNALLPFSDICFGPPRKEKSPPKHDAHVQQYVLSKIPAPYKKRYIKEPRFTITIESKSDGKACLSIQRLTRVEGFCRCINMKQREEIKSIPFEKINGIQMKKNSQGSFDLQILLLP